MGNDGGSIPTRRELVKEAARLPSAAELKESLLEQQAYYWTTDPISLLPLTSPIVSDWSGKLYNKETILELLVEGKYKDEAARVSQNGLSSLKDVVNLHFDVFSDNDHDKDKGGTARGAIVVKDVSTASSVWKCPVTGDRLGANVKAVYLVPCGHVFSARAIKEVSGEKCLTCETEFSVDDIIPIAPTAAVELARLAQRIKSLREKGLTHSLKKTSGGEKKKRKKDKSEGSSGETVAQDETKGHGERENGERGLSARREQDLSSRKKNESAKINNALAANVTAKVLEEQDRAKKRKLNDNVASLFSSRDASAPLGKSADFMTRGFTLPAQSKR